MEARSNRPAPLACDPWLEPYRKAIARRRQRRQARLLQLTGGRQSLADFAAGHTFFGLHRTADGWVMREWAPNAERIVLLSDGNGWRECREYHFKRLAAPGQWELRLPAAALRHGMNYLLRVYWPGGHGDRIPAYARYVVQDETTKLFCAQVWAPEKNYQFRHPAPELDGPLLIYEAHVGMAQEESKVGSFAEFREKILPRIAASGYNTIQLMAILSHPYYGSFGYHVANFFSIASRFGTPDEFKELVDAAHALKLRVIIDLVHSHAVKNEIEGLGRFDGTRCQYFHAGDRGEHFAWDSLCFDYGKPEVLHFLLSNCRFWLDEYQLDGFRFDGVTSMLYLHHGLGHAFTGYADYFGDQVDEDAYAYLALANQVIHEVRPAATTVAEDVSGMPGLGAGVEEGGCGFDYRMAMGVTDYWFRLFDVPDESWDMFGLYHELTNRRPDERTVSYVECHDQAIVGGQTAIFRLIGAEMYRAMALDTPSLIVDRGVALHKLARLATLATAGDGYLNFMGNEFGHPEWVDFPREGNQWSNHYARRQWSLADADYLRYGKLQNFDRAMLALLKVERVFDTVPQCVRIDQQGKVLAFNRGTLWFFFNFHPADSYDGYRLEVLPGEYRLVLDSDAPQFNGFGRVVPEQRYFTQAELSGGDLRHLLQLYLPCRTALVLKRLN